MKNQHLKELDAVLSVLADASITSQNLFLVNITSLAIGKNKGLSFVNMQLTMDKLVQDGFVTVTQPIGVYEKFNAPKRTYQITFEGLVFIEQGGYVTKSEIANKDLTRSKYFNWAIAVGGGVATIYYSLEILHHYIEPIWQHVCNCQFIWQK